jgi:hypothetical protein
VAPLNGVALEDHTSQRPFGADRAAGPTLLMKRLPDSTMVSPAAVELMAPATVTAPAACTESGPLRVDALSVMALASRSDTLPALVAVTELKLLAALVAVRLPAPTMVNGVAAVTTPPSVSDDAAEVVPTVAVFAVIVPATEVVPVPVSAPAPPTPTPFRVSGSATRATLLTFSVAPAATVVPLVVAPRALLLAATSVPALTLVAPL